MQPCGASSDDCAVSSLKSSWSTYLASSDLALLLSSVNHAVANSADIHNRHLQLLRLASITTWSNRLAHDNMHATLEA